MWTAMPMSTLDVLYRRDALLTCPPDRRHARCNEKRNARAGCDRGAGRPVP